MAGSFPAELLISDHKFRKNYSWNLLLWDTNKNFWEYSKLWFLQWTFNISSMQETSIVYMHLGWEKAIAKNDARDAWMSRPFFISEFSRENSHTPKASHDQNTGGNYAN